MVPNSEYVRPLLLLSLLAATCAGCRGNSDAGGGDPAAQAAIIPSEVKVTQARMIAWPRTVRVQGSLMGDERVIVGAKVGGRVASLGVDAQHRPIDLGSEVREGDVLARLESEEFELKVQEAESQLEQVRATLGLEKDQSDASLDPTKAPTVVQEKALLDEAKANLQRAEALSQQTAISGEELQQRKTQVDVAAAKYESALHGVDETIASLGVRRAELAIAQQILKDSEIRAPFGGVVEQRYIAPGAYVQVGQPVAALVKIDPWRFHANVPERHVQVVKMGQPVTIRIEGESQALEAVIVRISPSVEISNRSLAIEAMRKPASDGNAAGAPAAAQPDVSSRLRRGLFAEGDIIIDADAKALTVPRSAIQEFAGVEKVWRVTGSEAWELTVKTGRRNDQFIEIVSGLDEGDTVVVSGTVKQAGPVEVIKDGRTPEGAPAAK
jgi:RND family efflux transporter MFP subunit